MMGKSRTEEPCHHLSSCYREVALASEKTSCLNIRSDTGSKYIKTPLIWISQIEQQATVTALT